MGHFTTLCLIGGILTGLTVNDASGIEGDATNATSFLSRPSIEEQSIIPMLASSCYSRYIIEAIDQGNDRFQLILDRIPITHHLHSTLRRQSAKTITW